MKHLKKLMILTCTHHPVDFLQIPPAFPIKIDHFHSRTLENIPLLGQSFPSWKNAWKAIYIYNLTGHDSQHRATNVNLFLFFSGSEELSILENPIIAEAGDVKRFFFI